MRLAPSKTAKAAGYKRAGPVRDQTPSVALREIFPQVRRLRIELAFSDEGACTPSPQLHMLYPAASALFRFPCPCGDCDGDFDLTAAIAKLVQSTSARTPLIASSSGQLRCEGVRLRELAGRKPCVMLLNFQLGVDRSDAPDWEATAGGAVREQQPVKRGSWRRRVAPGAS